MLNGRTAPLKKKPPDSETERTAVTNQNVIETTYVKSSGSKQQ